MFWWHQSPLLPAQTTQNMLLLLLLRTCPHPHPVSAHGRLQAGPASSPCSGVPESWLQRLCALAGGARGQHWAPLLPTDPPAGAQRAVTFRVVLWQTRDHRCRRLCKDGRRLRRQSSIAHLVRTSARWQVSVKPRRWLHAESPPSQRLKRKTHRAEGEGRGQCAHRVCAAPADGAVGFTCDRGTEGTVPRTAGVQGV